PIKQILTSFNRGPKFRLSFVGIHFHLVHFLREHNKCVYLAIRGNQDLFGTVMFVFLVTNIPINVFLVRRIVFESNAPLETAIYWMVVFLQACASYIAM